MKSTSAVFGCCRSRRPFSSAILTGTHQSRFLFIVKPCCIYAVHFNRHNTWHCFIPHLFQDNSYSYQTQMLLTV